MKVEEPLAVVQGPLPALRVAVVLEGSAPQQLQSRLPLQCFRLKLSERVQAARVVAEFETQVSLQLA